MGKAAAAAPGASRWVASLWSAVLLLATLSAAQDLNVCPYNGGWSLRVNTKYCPSNAPIDCGLGTQRRCCPSGFVCAGVGAQGGSWCCKEGEDCLSQARENPRCPNQQWTLWGEDGTVSEGAWCCQPGYNGFYKKNEGVGCTEAGVNTLASNAFFAKTVPTTQCATSSPTSSSSSSSTTTTTTTSLSSSGPLSPTATSQNAEGGGAGRSSNDSDENDAATGLGSGAIAGIAVGCVAGVAVIAGLLGTMIWRRRKTQAAAAAQDPQNARDGYAQNGKYPYFSGGGDGSGQQTTEMHHHGGAGAGGGAGGGYASSSVGGYTGSTVNGYYSPSQPGQQVFEKDNAPYSPAELPNETRHLIGDQRAESHEAP